MHRDGANVDRDGANVDRDGADVDRDGTNIAMHAEFDHIVCHQDISGIGQLDLGLYLARLRFRPLPGYQKRVQQRSCWDGRESCLTRLVDD